MGTALHLKKLTLTYQSQKKPALYPANLTIPAGEILSLIGPSGSGKTTLLRLIAGLNRPTSGSIHLGDTCISDAKTFTPPEKRPIGLVAQSGDLFPHLTVAKNIAYGLNHWKRCEKRNRVNELLEAIELPGFGKRYPAELSGGEAQRIALARSLAPRPQILLLDEPFSSLDQELRSRIRTLTLAILQNSKTTALFVTHHQEDAHNFGNRVIALSQGNIMEPRAT